ncbi:hypothetical protein BLOT_009288 [Blomia tropicalis]|nr:hypothetical protein BLOT_009288 [Blomia tropicalis]
MSTHSVGSSWPMATLGERLSRFMRPHWLLRSTCTNVSLTKSCGCNKVKEQKKRKSTQTYSLRFIIIITSIFIALWLLPMAIDEQMPILMSTTGIMMEACYCYCWFPLLSFELVISKHCCDST